MMASEKSIHIDVLKAFAALIIINSHLEEFYPRAFMAADGMLGNTIFFFTTGFALAGSIARRPDESMLLFLWKRLIRLYPALWITMAVLPPQTPEWSTLAGWREAMLYPTFYTFVNTIIPLYPLYFLVQKIEPLKRRMNLLGGLCLAGSFALAVTQESGGPGHGVAWSALGPYVWRAHFFGAMLLGGWHASRAQVIATTTIRAGTRFTLVAAVYIVLRLLALPPMAARLGPAADYLALLSMSCCVLVCFEALRLLDAPWCQAWFRTRTPAFVVAFLATHSWETYLLHEGISHLGFVATLPFPASVLGVFVITLALAPILHWITDPRRLQSARKSV